MRLIDAEAFQKFIEQEDDSADYERCRFEEWLEEQPTIEAKPVVHAHWNKDGRCTNCGKHASWIPFSDDWFESAYCNKCGARMDEVAEDD